MVFLEPFRFRNVNSVIFYRQKILDYSGPKYKEGFGEKKKGFFFF